MVTLKLTNRARSKLSKSTTTVKFPRLMRTNQKLSIWRGLNLLKRQPTSWIGWRMMEQTTANLRCGNTTPFIVECTQLKIFSKERRFFTFPKIRLWHLTWQFNHPSVNSWKQKTSEVDCSHPSTPSYQLLSCKREGKRTLITRDISRFFRRSLTTFPFSTLKMKRRGLQEAHLSSR